jgi:hypothetical protein
MVTCDACVLSHDYQKGYQAGLVARFDPTTVAMMREVQRMVLSRPFPRSSPLFIWARAGYHDLPKEDPDEPKP